MFAQGYGQDLFESVFVNVVSMLLPILLVIVLIFFIARVVSRRSSRDLRQKASRMVSEYDEANMARAKSVGAELFYSVDMAALPIREYGDDKPVGPSLWQEKVVKAAAKKMINFDRAYSNSELKQMFGAVNLEQVAGYEENFSSFIHSMRHWAQALIDSGDLPAARMVLEESVRARAESSATYTLLAKLYHDMGDTASLKGLHDDISNSDMPSKNMVLKNIAEYLQ